MGRNVVSTKDSVCPLDYDDVVIHLFYEPAREFYRLETNWIDAREVKLPEPIRTQAEGLRIRALG